MCKSEMKQMHSAIVESTYGVTGTMPDKETVATTRYQKAQMIWADIQNQVKEAEKRAGL